MKRRVCSVILCCLAVADIQAQTAIPMQLQAFYRQIDSVLADMPAGTCKNSITSYKNGLAMLNTTDADAALQQFHQLNAGLAGQSIPACKWVILRVKSIDSITKAAGGSTASGELLNALIFLKIKAQGFVLANLRAEDDNGKLVEPLVSILSTSPSIFVRDASDKAKPLQLFVRPDADYEIEVFYDGYEKQTLQLKSLRLDTNYVMVLKPMAVQPDPEPRPHDITGKENGFFKWLSVALVLLSIFLAWRMIAGKRRTPIPPPVPVQEKIPVREPPPIINNLMEPKERGSISSGRHFVAEMMMTAGPRKKPMGQPNSDTDLGEDVCGFISVNQEVLLWVLDGSSDLYVLKYPQNGREYFSSRLLAQSIARKLKARLVAMDTTPLNEVFLSIISEVKADWTRHINALPEEEKKILRKNIDSGNLPQCAATVLIARLLLDGSLVAYRTGDCKLFLYEGTEKNLRFRPSVLSLKNETSDDRIFFGLRMGDNGEINVVHNQQPRYEVVTEKNINAIIGVSDGVGAETINALQTEFAQDTEGIRTRLIRQLQGTDDDKSICIIEIKDDKGI